ncbi:PREDICTED: protein sarah-like [Rhagoletis zephyria]|uniref:protein sarah-like n=1 Tax=Rhagoletis zephyria TaxID=28612 RepID=UPI000811450D|nr:PREDICTED: protein sarah-like [Rhagoletis zephyria]
MDLPMEEHNGADSSDGIDVTTGNPANILANGHPEPDSTTNGYPDDASAAAAVVANSSAVNGLVTNDQKQSTEMSNNGTINNSNSKSYVTQAESLLNINELDELNRLIGTDPNASVVVDGFELPRSLIITNIDSRVFQVGTEERAQFEETFRAVDSTAIFLYFRSFRRARVDFAASVHATKARILCNQRRIGEEAINVYYAEIAEVPQENRHLRPPALEKQFLISPPASPPEGWEPVEEAQPVLNIDLQSALANLLPGTSHELHAATDNQPGIFVHICPDTTTDQNVVSASSKDEVDGADDDDGGEENVAGGKKGIEVSGVFEVEEEEEEEEECMSAEDFNASILAKRAPSLQMMGQVFGSGGGGGGGMPMSRKIPHTPCPPSMSTQASAARRED